MTDTTDTTQRCPKCEKDLPLDAYYERHRGKPGNYCCDCNRAYLRAYAARRYKPKPLPACAVLDCQRKVKAPDRSYCARHHHTDAKHGQPTWTRPAGVDYRSAHRAVQRTRGPATNHTCRGCGQPAQDWAYRHDDPAERSQQWYGKTVTYSLDPAHYDPMCRPCHSRFDMRSGHTPAWLAARLADQRKRHATVDNSLSSINV